MDAGRERQEAAVAADAKSPAIVAPEIADLADAAPRRMTRTGMAVAAVGVGGVVCSMIDYY